jgi:hypothetical protein
LPPPGVRVEDGADASDACTVDQPVDTAKTIDHSRVEAPTAAASTTSNPAA